MVNLSFALSVTETHHLRFLAGKTKGAESLAVGRHSSMHTCAQMTAPHYKLLKDYYQKRTETSLHEKIPIKKSTPCSDVSMHECTG